MRTSGCCDSSSGVTALNTVPSRCSRPRKSNCSPSCVSAHAMEQQRCGSTHMHACALVCLRGRHNIGNMPGKCSGRSSASEQFKHLCQCAHCSQNCSRFCKEDMQHDSSNKPHGRSLPVCPHLLDRQVSPALLIVVDVASQLVKGLHAPVLCVFAEVWWVS